MSTHIYCALGFSTTRIHFCLAAPPALQAFKAFVAEVKAEDCSFYRKDTIKRPRLSFKWQHNLLSLHICLKSRDDEASVQVHPENLITKIQSNFV